MLFATWRWHQPVIIVSWVYMGTGIPSRPVRGCKVRVHLSHCFTNCSSGHTLSMYIYIQPLGVRVCICIRTYVYTVNPCTIIYTQAKCPVPSDSLHPVRMKNTLKTCTSLLERVFHGLDGELLGQGWKEKKKYSLPWVGLEHVTFALVFDREFQSLHWNWLVLSRERKGRWVGGCWGDFVSGCYGCRR